MGFVAELVKWSRCLRMMEGLEPRSGNRSILFWRVFPAIALGLLSSLYSYFSGTLDGLGFLSRLIGNPLAYIWKALYWIPAIQVALVLFALRFRNSVRKLVFSAVAVAALALIVQVSVFVVEVDLAMRDNVTIKGWWVRLIAPISIAVLGVAIARALKSVPRNRDRNSGSEANTLDH